MGRRASLEAMLARGQDSALLRFSLGNECLKEQQHAEAVTHLESAVSQDPAYSAAWKLLGKALADAGENERAMDAYWRGIAVARARGDVQAAREMEVFLRRLRKKAENDNNG